MSPYINRATLAFWVIGLLNNMPYVIMLAGAKNISEGGTALVFIANVLPSLLLKISSPYWFDKVCYRTRMKAGSILMASSFCVVAWFSRMGEVEDQNQNKEGVSSFNVMMQLIGVALGSAQGGLGEATLLALSGKADSVMQNERLSVINYDENYRVVGELDGISENAAPKGEDKSMCIAAFSSGTGFAGIAGFLFVFICTRIFSLSLPGTLSFCLILPILYWYVFEKCLAEYTHTDLVNEEVLDTGSSEIMLTSNELIALSSGNHANASDSTTSSEDDFQDNPASRDNSDDENSESSSMHLTERDPTNNIPIDTMSAFERFRLILSLWPYMVPLFTVYAAEYALQSGVWAAIGFPVDDVLKRDSFYVASNWVVS
jgi:battenin